jgi:glycosyltransferase involved in cell wall biosynthesis
LTRTTERASASDARPLDAVPSVSLCFPAYNEEASIAFVVEEAHHIATQAGLDFEIIVCNDGSTDRTGAELDRLTRMLPRMRSVHHPVNRGIRATFEHLYALATKEFVFLNSTDRQWDTHILLDMLPLTRDWDVIVAARRRKPYTPLRQLISWSFNAIPALLFGVRTVDAGAVKLQRREIVTRFPAMSRSPFTEVERMVRATRAGYRYTFFPVDVSPRHAGREHGADWSNVWLGIVDVGRVWWDVVRHSQPDAVRRSS